MPPGDQPVAAVRQPAGPGAGAPAAAARAGAAAPAAVPPAGRPQHSVITVTQTGDNVSHFIVNNPSDYYAKRNPMYLCIFTADELETAESVHCRILCRALWLQMRLLRPGGHQLLPRHVGPHPHHRGLSSRSNHLSSLTFILIVGFILGLDRPRMAALWTVLLQAHHGQDLLPSVHHQVRGITVQTN